MKLVAQVKLLPTIEQTNILKQTLEISNDACNYISEIAWKAKVFHQFPLHKLIYYTIRKDFPLSAQVVVRCISKVANAYKPNQRKQRIFRQLGGIAFDDRILSWQMSKSEVSIWTVVGRVHIPFTCGEHQRELLSKRHGESNLCFVDNTFYLFTFCDVETLEPIDVNGILGIDLGIVNLAADSDGETYSGNAVEMNRRKFLHRRRNLQKKQTKSAKHKLKKLSGKQTNFQKNTDHTISKRIVQKAQGTERAIALEDLGGIRERVTVRHKQRARYANWSFYRLRQYISYKAIRAGIPVILVDPRNTSRTCPECGCIDKANRRTQSLFLCTSCGYSAPADVNAAVIIAARAAVKQPMVSNIEVQGQVS